MSLIEDILPPLHVVADVEKSNSTNLYSFNANDVCVSKVIPAAILALERAPLKEAITTEESIPIIEMTTRSSMRVKPLASLDLTMRELYYGRPWFGMNAVWIRNLQQT
jgi:hypothetical protein